jgi:hypothetical protein
VNALNTSYLTVDEYLRAPTGISTVVDYTNINDQNAQRAEIANVIARASAWIDNYLELPNGLYASINTETRAVNVSRDGLLRIRPWNVPIIQVLSFQWRAYPTAQWVTVDPTTLQVYERYFEYMTWFPFFNGPALTVGNEYAYPISAPYTPYLTPTESANISDLQITAQFSYINGYPNTTLSVDAKAGDTTITVDDATGVINGTVLTMYDGSMTEKIAVSGVAGNVLTLRNPLRFDHTAGIAVSAIPADVKQACILLCNYLLKERGTNAITLEGVTNPVMNKYFDDKDVSMAKELLRRYRRVV